MATTTRKRVLTPEQRERKNQRERERRAKIRAAKNGKGKPEQAKKKCDGKCENDRKKCHDGGFDRELDNLCLIFCALKKFRTLFSRYSSIMDAMSELVIGIGGRIIAETEKDGKGKDAKCLDCGCNKSVDGEFTEKITIEKIDLPENEIKKILDILKKANKNSCVKKANKHQAKPRKAR